jgi:oligopeptidase A
MKFITKEHRNGNERFVLRLPAWESFDPSLALEELRGLISEGRALAERQSQSRGGESPVRPWEELLDRLGKTWGPLSHLYGVDQESYPGIVAAYEEGERLLSEYSTDICQHAGLYSKYRSFAASNAYVSLDAEERRILDESLLDFRLSGVELSPENKARLKSVIARLAELSTRFSQHVQDAQNAWSKFFADDHRLKGVHPDVLATMRDAARREGKEGFLVTVHQPIYIALIERAADRELRREVYEAYHTRASDQGPLAGQFDTGPLMREIVALRAESAKILGYPTYNALRLEKRMAPSVGDVTAFLGRLEREVVGRAKEEYARLVEFARRELSLEDLLPWDIAYASRAMREKEFGIDQETLRAYFPEDRVFVALFELLRRIYGIEFREQTDVPMWRDGVRFFEVVEKGNVIGGVYADLYARRGKRPGAWMDSAVDRFVESDRTIQLPIAYFNCNFLPQLGDRAFLRHDEVETVFHEFGHVIHHLLSMTRFPSSGMGSVEWDAVEFPSQIMERWCWEPELLRTMTAHRETGAPMPEELIERLVASRNFQVAMFLSRQLALATFDWELHLLASENPDVQAVWDQVQTRILPAPYPAWSRFPNAFSHIFDGGYAAGYYSYLWAEVLAADAFEEFHSCGVFDESVGGRFRREVLAPGSTRPMIEGFRAFLRRDPDLSALLRSYGLIH